MKLVLLALFALTPAAKPQAIPVPNCLPGNSACICKATPMFCPKTPTQPAPSFKR